MLKIKDNVDLKELKKFGFKLEHEHAYYYFKIDDDSEIFVWIKNSDDYKLRHIYIECINFKLIFSNLNVIYDLIKADLVEKVDD